MSTPTKTYACRNAESEAFAIRCTSDDFMWDMGYHPGEPVAVRQVSA